MKTLVTCYAPYIAVLIVGAILSPQMYAVGLGAEDVRNPTAIFLHETMLAGIFSRTLHLIKSRMTMIWQKPVVIAMISSRTLDQLDPVLKAFDEPSGLL